MSDIDETVFTESERDPLRGQILRALTEGMPYVLLTAEPIDPQEFGVTLEVGGGLGALKTAHLLVMKVHRALVEQVEPRERTVVATENEIARVIGAVRDGLASLDLAIGTASDISAGTTVPPQVLDGRADLSYALSHLEMIRRSEPRDATDRLSSDVRMITVEDIRQQVTATLSSDSESIDVDAVTQQIIRTYGLVGLETIPDGEYWAIVREHDSTQR